MADTVQMSQFPLSYLNLEILILHQHQIIGESDYEAGDEESLRVERGKA